ncbi:30S ribosomal protein S2 [bacterium]|nr:30S ribosomal protein S2 [bacterium]
MAEEKEAASAVEAQEAAPAAETQEAASAAEGKGAASAAEVKGAASAAGEPTEASTESGGEQQAGSAEGSAPTKGTSYRSDFEVVEAEPVTLQSLLHAGAHFGHQCHRWNPQMLRYIYGEKNGTHILNLDITLERWKQAEKFLEDVANRGGSILIVGTKPQAREIARGIADRIGAFSVTQRWLGGTLSNFETIKKSIHRMKKIEELLQKAEEEGSTVRLNKKERLNMRRDLDKLESNLGGIRHMRHVPDVLFVVDVQRDAIAVREARKLHIPVVALVDTNVDPSMVDYPIPSNDDASRTLKLFLENVAAAFSRGKQAFVARGNQRNAGRHAAGKDGARVSPNGEDSGTHGEVEVLKKKSSSSDKETKEAAGVAASA